MVLETSPMMNWSEVRLVLSPTEMFKAAAIGGMGFDEAHLIEFWLMTRADDEMRTHLEDGASYGLQTLLGSVPFEQLYHNPSPFITDDST
jgi:hypothetical protein